MRHYIVGKNNQILALKSLVIATGAVHRALKRVFKPIMFALLAGGCAVLPVSLRASSAVATAGQSVSLSVSASGTAPMTYQWYKDGSTVTGGNAATLSLATVSARDAGSYLAIVSNAAGSTTSDTASLTVNAAVVAPTIVSQPASVTALEGTSVTFAVSATGSGPLVYQWQKNGVPLGGATSTSFTFPAVLVSDAGSYSVVVTNAAGTIYSSSATLIVNSAQVAPVIVTQPLSQSVSLGNAVQFIVSATGTPLYYQWMKGGVDIAGATSSFYSIANSTAASAGNYSVDVYNNAGAVTSVTATLSINTILTPPAITSQPLSVKVRAGQSASFTVAASGSGPLTYQWTKNGANISGATSASLVFASTALSDAAMYSVSVKNAAGSVISNGATLTVNQQTKHRK